MSHPPAASGTRPRRDAKGTRDRLARAALDLFSARGYHGTTTPQIASRAGVAEGTIYRHFASKDHLFNEVYRAGVRLFAGSIGRLDPGSPSRVRLDALARDWQQLAVEEPALVELVFRRRDADARDQRSRDAERQLLAAIEQVLAQGKAAGEIRSGSVATLAETWVRAVGLILERLAAREWRPGDAATQQVIDSAWDAIRVPAGPHSRNP